MKKIPSKVGTRIFLAAAEFVGVSKLTTYLILHCLINVNARAVVTISICQLYNFLNYLHFFYFNATPTHTKSLLET